MAPENMHVKEERAHRKSLSQQQQPMSECQQAWDARHGHDAQAISSKALSGFTDAFKPQQFDLVLQRAPQLI